MRPPAWPRPNHFLESLRSDVPPVSMWITLQSTNLVEIAGACGVDAVILDLEHTTSGLSDIHAMIIAAELGGMTALVRPAGIDHHEIGRILDAGAKGIVFPMVSNLTDAETAARSVRYPPRGIRGWAGTHARHVRWSGTHDSNENTGVLRPDFVAAADESIASIFMIENAEGVESIDDILDTGEPDAVIFGWADFTVQAGFDDDRVAEARKRVYDASRERDIGMGISMVPSDGLSCYPGCFVSAGVDATICSTAISHRMDQVRSMINYYRGQTT